MRFSTAARLGLLIAVISPGSALGYTITLVDNPQQSSVSSTHKVLAAEHNVDNAITLEVGALPFSGTFERVQARASSQAEYDFSNAGFHITLDHSRSGYYDSTALSNGYMYFTIDEHVDYVASGSYSTVDPEGRRVFFSSSLYDYHLGASLFGGGYESRSTPNESFTLGQESPGDYSGGYAGSLTGTLQPGHTYRYFYSAFIQSFPTAASFGASGTGSFSLVFVPEPSTGLLLAAGIAGLCLRRSAPAAGSTRARGRPIE